MDKTIYLKNNILFLLLRISQVLMGITFLFSGINYLLSDSTPSFISPWIYILLGILSLALSFLGSPKRNEMLKVDGENIFYRKSIIHKGIHFKANNIEKLNVTDMQLNIQYKNKTHMINFTAVSKSDRINKLPVIIEEIKNITSNNKIAT